jgi:murein DD-endopeptidase MepM/ murein hydrolase activator NlpD
LGIILMLGIFVTTGMIGSIQAAAPEEVISSTIKAHKVVLNGREAGYVCNQESAQIVMDEVLQDAAENFGMEVVTEHELAFSEVTIAPEQLSTKADLEQSLRELSEISVNAYVIYANNEKIGTMRSQEDADQLLDDIKAQYIEDETQLEDAFFQEEVEVIPTPVSFHEVEDIRVVEARIMEGQETVEEYTVVEGDTFWSISKKFQIDHDELTLMNADVEPDKLQLGQTIRLSYPKSLLNVVTTQVVEYEETIPYQTETQEDSSMFSNESKVIQDGKEGLKYVEARVIQVNGIEQEREILSEEVIEEPVNKVVKKGTKPPVNKGTGRLSWPAQGRLTSRYGRRWGRMHNGIDIANSKGTPIYAADSGKVIFSGWSGGYGNMVKIDHGGGMVTYYAHLSSRSVSNGSSVSKGQLIGYMGSTGNSTGSHLHFEVRINGSSRNPFNYLP